MALAAGTTLGPYEILSLIGAGGMGEVYFAREIRLGRRVALKVLPAELTNDPQRIARFEQEARSASALNHPNICTIFALGELPDGRYGCDLARSGERGPERADDARSRGAIHACNTGRDRLIGTLEQAAGPFMDWRCRPTGRPSCMNERHARVLTSC